jgi:hypothetical protein
MPSKMDQVVRSLGLEIEAFNSQTTLLKAPASEGELCASEIGVAHCLGRGVGWPYRCNEVLTTGGRRVLEAPANQTTRHLLLPAPGSRLLSPSKVPRFFHALVTRRDCCSLRSPLYSLSNGCSLLFATTPIKPSLRGSELQVAHSLSRLRN